MVFLLRRIIKKEVKTYCETAQKNNQNTSEKKFSTGGEGVHRFENLTLRRINAEFLGVSLPTFFRGRCFGAKITL